MTPKELTWHAKQTKALYKDWQLTLEQATQLFLVQQDRDLIRTYWDGLAYEYDQLQHILTPQQWPLYQADYERMLAEHEQSLRQQDSNQQATLSMAEQRLGFYRQQIIPALQALLAKQPLVLDLVKEVYLIGEYQRFLKQRKAEVLGAHYHEYRRFAPNTLRAALLEYELLEYVPDIQAFEKHADEPTRVMLRFVLERLGSRVSMFLAPELRPLEARIADFYQQAVESWQAKSGGRVLARELPQQTSSELQQPDQWAFWLLWLDKDRLLRAAAIGHH